MSLEALGTNGFGTGAMALSILGGFLTSWREALPRLEVR